jgi:hypothetical protein
MKNVFIPLFISLIFVSCDGIQDGIVDPSSGEVNIESIYAPRTLTYTDESTVVRSTLYVDNKEIVESIWFEIGSVDGFIRLANRVMMKDDGDRENSGDDSADDNTFTGIFPMSEEYPNGDYAIDYYMESTTGIMKKVGSAKFEYDNAQDNIAPVISEQDIPDQIERGVQFSFSVKATDQNGQADIRSVYYELFDPNGSQLVNSQGISQFPLFDDGNTQANGDLIAGDAVYTVFLTFPENVSTGTWTFRFRAEDRGGKLSNELVHNLEVQ